jgi:hypothetical protein
LEGIGEIDIYSSKSNQFYPNWLVLKCSVVLYLLLQFYRLEVWVMHASDVLKYGNLTLLSALDGLSTEECAVGGVCGWWSVKDIVAHLASHEVVLVDVLTGLMGGAHTPTLNQYLKDHMAFNDDQVDLRKRMSYAQVMGEYREAHTQVIALIARISDELIHRSGVLPWYGAEYDLEDYLAYGYYGHKREHSAQIMVYRDSLKARAPVPAKAAEF